MRPLVEKTPIEMNEEFEMAIKPFMHDLRKYCLSLTNTSWDGEDLMQDTLIKAYESWMKMPKQIAKAFLYRIASNTWIDKHRKRKIEEDMNQDLTNYKQEEATMTEAAFQTISAVLNELSCKQRAVVLFMWGFGYTAKETAGLLSVSEGSVKAALNRARKNIKRINFTNDFFEHDEDKSIPFIDALRNENPEAILRLYQKEIKEPFMQFSNRNHPISSSSLTVQSIGAGSTPYMLISIPKKNGGVLFVPFYQLELSALLSQIAWVEQKEFLAVA